MSFDSIVGQELSAVEFVQDYLQLRFDGPVLTLFEWPDLFLDEGSYAFGEPEYRNILCAQIAQTVSAASLVEGEAMEIEFENGVILRASLRMEDVAGPEAGHFASGDDGDELLEF